MCGVVGIISSKKSVAGEIYDSLIHLQHRGQDAAGIMTYNERFHIKKGTGLIRDIFDEQNMSRLLGHVGIGHTRYPTVGGFSIEEETVRRPSKKGEDWEPSVYHKNYNKDMLVSMYDVHPNEKGHQVIAEFMYEQLG